MIPFLLACSDPPPDGVAPEDRLIRVSVSLRGARPTGEELLAVGADPRLVEVYTDLWLDDPRFGETVREIHEQAWWTDSDVTQLPASGSLARYPMRWIRSSVLGSALHLVERVVMDERPYTDVVTADWFVADAVVAAAWPDVVGYDPIRPPEEWQVVTWGDGRPAAGVLSDSGLWLRYRSPNTNFNRQRANALSRALLCHDFLEGETEPSALPVDVADVAAANDAVATVPGCVACHQDLDTLAGFFPFDPFWSVPDMRFPYAVYDPVYEEQWREMTGRPPAYFGLGGGDLAALGRHVAADPRFAQCAARRFYGAFAGVDPGDVPLAIAAELQDVLVSSGFDAKALARAAVLHSSLDEPGRERIATPRHYARAVEGITGFRWEADVTSECCDADAGSSEYGPTELAVDQYHGFDVVGGGFDGDATLAPARDHTVGAALFRQRLAERAAAFAVANGTLEADATDPEHAREQIVALHLAVLGEVRPGDREVDRTLALWQALRELHDDPARAWERVIAAMLQDHRLVVY